MQQATRYGFSLASLLVLPGIALGQSNGAFTQTVPTLDEFGLAALVVAVSAAAGWAMKRRQK